MIFMTHAQPYATSRMKISDPEVKKALVLWPVHDALWDGCYMIFVNVSTSTVAGPKMDTFGL